MIKIPYHRSKAGSDQALSFIQNRVERTSNAACRKLFNTIGY